ncbi:H-NS histone family protein, partial [Clostridioides difficile]|nr:H-NS histone family protein [Clostridioides difficile]
LKAQIHALEKQAEELRQADLQTVIAELREKVQEYELTPDDIFGGRRMKPKAKVTLPPKYRNPNQARNGRGVGA